MSASRREGETNPPSLCSDSGAAVLSLKLVENAAKALGDDVDAAASASTACAAATSWANTRSFSPALANASKSSTAQAAARTSLPAQSGQCVSSLVARRAATPWAMCSTSNAGPSRKPLAGLLQGGYDPDLAFSAAIQS